MIRVSSLRSRIERSRNILLALKPSQGSTGCTDRSRGSHSRAGCRVCTACRQHVPRGGAAQLRVPSYPELRCPVEYVLCVDIGSTSKWSASSLGFAGVSACSIRKPPSPLPIIISAIMTTGSYGRIYRRFPLLPGGQVVMPPWYGHAAYTPGTWPRCHTSY